jgi:cytochrome c peroxidase
MRKPVALVLALSVVAAGAVQAAALTPEQALGRMLYLDPNLALHRNQSCATCHGLEPVAGGGRPPAAGFVDPENVRRGTPVSAGSVAGRSGALNAPSVGYAAFSPAFHWDPAEKHYVGGQFWNGRAATLADQAGQPLLNPAEMAMPGAWAVVARLKEQPRYVERFRAVYGLDLKALPDPPPGRPDAPAPAAVADAYAKIARAIAEFERSSVFNRFTSKYDFYLAGRATLSAQERRGLEVFEDRGKCAECHPSKPGAAADGRMLAPLFTDFTYDNLGLPRNANLPGNPPPDAGLGARADVAARDPAGAERGKHKVVTLRNVAVTPPYGHNGVFRTLAEIVRFYNTRDTLKRVCPDNNDPGFARDCWPRPEIAANVNTEELGNLGLDAADEAALVAFMQTLTDGYPDWGRDPKVPPGTPSPFAHMVPPP